MLALSAIRLPPNNSSLMLLPQQLRRNVSWGGLWLALTSVKALTMRQLVRAVCWPRNPAFSQGMVQRYLLCG